MRSLKTGVLLRVFAGGGSGGRASIIRWGLVAPKSESMGSLQSLIGWSADDGEGRGQLIKVTKGETVSSGKVGPVTANGEIIRSTYLSGKGWEGGGVGNVRGGKGSFEDIEDDPIYQGSL